MKVKYEEKIVIVLLTNRKYQISPLPILEIHNAMIVSHLEAPSHFDDKRVGRFCCHFPQDVLFREGVRKFTMSKDMMLMNSLYSIKGIVTRCCAHGGCILQSRKKYLSSAAFTQHP